MTAGSAADPIARSAALALPRSLTRNAATGSAAAGSLRAAMVSRTAHRTLKAGSLRAATSAGVFSGPPQTAIALAASDRPNPSGSLSIGSIALATSTRRASSGGAFIEATECVLPALQGRGTEVEEHLPDEVVLGGPSLPGREGGHDHVDRAAVYVGHPGEGDQFGDGLGVARGPDGVGHLVAASVPPRVVLVSRAAERAR